MYFGGTIYQREFEHQELLLNSREVLLLEHEEFQFSDPATVVQPLLQLPTYKWIRISNTVDQVV